MRHTKTMRLERTYVLLLAGLLASIPAANARADMAWAPPSRSRNAGPAPSARVVAPNYGFGIGYGRPYRPVPPPPVVPTPTLGPPLVRLTRVIAAGPLRVPQLRSAMQTNQASVTQCYAEGLRRRAILIGEVAIRFVIGGDGRVQATTVVSTTLPAEEEVPQCVALSVRDVTFPADSAARSTLVTATYSLSRTVRTPAPRRAPQPRRLH